MKGSLDFLVWSVAIVVLLFGFKLLSYGNDKHKCDSPCTVKFPKWIQEDNFKIDYTNHSLIVTHG